MTYNEDSDSDSENQQSSNEIENKEEGEIIENKKIENNELMNSLNEFMSEINALESKSEITQKENNQNPDSLNNIYTQSNGNNESVYQWGVTPPNQPPLSPPPPPLPPSSPPPPPTANSTNKNNISYDTQNTSENISYKILETSGEANTAQKEPSFASYNSIKLTDSNFHISNSSDSNANATTTAISTGEVSPYYISSAIILSKLAYLASSECVLTTSTLPQDYLHQQIEFATRYQDWTAGALNNEYYIYYHDQVKAVLEQIEVI